MNSADYTKKIEELKNLTPKFSDKNGKPYVDWEQYRDAMNQAFGVCYEPLMVGEPQITFLPKENGGITAMATVSVEVIIYDESRNVIAKRRAPGSVVFEKVKDTGEYAWPQNVTFNAYTAAFRNCCKLFGIFENAERPKCGNRSGSKTSRSSANESEKNSGVRTYHVVSKGNVIISGGDDGKKKVYKLRCIDNADRIEKDLIIYEDKMEPGKLSELIARINIGPGVPYKLSFNAYTAKKGDFERPQLIFHDFV